MMNSPLGTSRLIALAVIGLLSSAALTTFGQTTTLSFESVAELRASGIPASGTAALTGGYYVGGDGGGNRFIWSANSTADDNGGTIIRPNAIASASAGRWLATVTGTFNVKMFGAKGDRVTDDTASFNAAITAANPVGKTLSIPSGAYLIAPGTLPNIKVSVDGPTAVLIAANNDDADFISIDYSGSTGPGSETFRVSRLVGYNPGTTRNGCGLKIKHADFSHFTVNEIEGWNVAVYLAGTESGGHIAVNDFHFTQIAGNRIGIQLNSGPTDAEHCESNQIFANYVVDNTFAGIYLGGGNDTMINSNEISVISMEQFSNQAHEIVCDAEAKYNFFRVTGIFQVAHPPGNGKLIVTSGTNNSFEVNNADLSLITKTGDDIIDGVTAGIGGTGSSTYITRSRIFAPAPPTTGKWRLGDVFFNNSTISPLGWRCVADGTPGTWVEMGQTADDFSQGAIKIGSFGHIIGRNSADGALWIGGGQATIELKNSSNVTGNFFATGTLGGSNLSGTNTGDASIAAQNNGITASLSGQALTIGGANLTPASVSASGNISVGDDKTTSALRIGTFGHKIGRDASDGSMVIGGGQARIILLNDLQTKLPTSSAGLPSGTLWNNGGTPAIVP